MKRYKHKATGYIAEGSSDGFNYTINPNQGVIPKVIIENSKEWEQIKGYTILEKKYNDDWKHVGPAIHKASNDCHDNICHIWKVRRESDQLVFTVGDYYPLVSGGISKIRSFGLIGDDIFIKTELDHTIFLESWKKCEEFLFKSEDKVDIYFGDTTYIVFNNLTPKENAGYDKKWKVCGGYPENSKSNYGNEYYKVFSSKKSASDYIKLNQPIFSAQDLMDHPYISTMSSKTGSFRVLDRYPQLEKLIDSKLNL